jgi:hypothetical protein
LAALETADWMMLSTQVREYWIFLDSYTYFITAFIVSLYVSMFVLLGQLDAIPSRSNHVTP